MIIIKMVKSIDIQYCGSWGYGWTASRLKASIQSAFPEININCHSAQALTGKIKATYI